MCMARTPARILPGRVADGKPLNRQPSGGKEDMDTSMRTSADDLGATRTFAATSAGGAYRLRKMAPDSGSRSVATTRQLGTQQTMSYSPGGTFSNRKRPAASVRVKYGCSQTNRSAIAQWTFAGLVSSTRP